LGRGRAARRRELKRGRADAAEHRVERELLADHARREDDHLLRLEAEQPAGLRRHRPGGDEALLARGGVRVAGVRHDRLRLRKLEMLLRDGDRRGLDAVGREHPGARRGQERADERHVPPRLADAGVDAGCGEALRGGHAHTSTPLRRRPAVSSRPSARFAFWSAWPAAPLPRLSRAQTTTVRPVARSAKTPISALSVCWTRAISGTTPSGSTRTTALPAYASTSSSRASASVVR